MIKQSQFGDQIPGPPIEERFGIIQKHLVSPPELCRETASNVSYKQLCDPAKLVAAYHPPGPPREPPVHLPLGKDTYGSTAKKTAAFEKEIAEWYGIITGLDHDDVTGS